jgi:NAD(P)-dependent dehydrogenase (short-subunit alcohol dehydrogenase family)
MRKIEDQSIILVTGGNRGIGREICHQLAEIGHQVILGSRDFAKGRSAATEMGFKIDPVQLDVTIEKDIESVSDYIQSHYGRLDVLINNAGIIGSKTLHDLDLAEVRNVMEVNFYGPMKMNNACIPLLRRSKDPRIINISSGMGAFHEMSTGYAGYRLSKTGLNAQTVLLHNELKNIGIQVYAMCPGWVQTDMGGRDAPRSAAKGAETAIWLALEKGIRSGKFYRDKKQISW